MKVKITKKIIECWSSYIGKYNKFGDTYDDNKNPVTGKLWWVLPNDVLWLYATQNEEGYDGSQTQIGVRVDGTLVWGYFSHCSCYGYEDYKGEVEELKEENLIHTHKCYEMNNVDSGVLEIIKSRLREISKQGLKDAFQNQEVKEA